jgi:hypothetical protein
MNKRPLNTIEDLISNVSFRRWVEAGEGAAYWEPWQLQYPGRTVLIANASAIVLAMQVPRPQLPMPEMEEQLRQIREKAAAIPGTEPRMVK